MTRRNGSESRESEAWAEAFARRAPLKEAVEAALDAQQLDAFVFPTLRREPALIGEPQRGSACQLSATSGLPSLSMPVGFTEGGLPIGMEMIGKELDDARLVSLAYAFEQSTEHRRAPSRTPSLVEGRAPAPVRIHVLAEGSEWDPVVNTSALVAGQLTYDQVGQSLQFDLRVEGVSASDVHAVVLRHSRTDGARVVVARLVGPGRRSAQGSLSLTPALNDALLGGRLSLELFTRAHPLGAARMRIAGTDGSLR